MVWGTVSQTGIFPWRGEKSEKSGAVVFLGNSSSSVSLTGGTSMRGGASVRGVLSPILVLLEEITHTCAEIEWFRRGGAP
jgi:hypothetical protein